MLFDSTANPDSAAALRRRAPDERRRERAAQFRAGTDAPQNPRGQLTALAAVVQHIIEAAGFRRTGIMQRDVGIDERDQQPPPEMGLCRKTAAALARRSSPERETITTCYVAARRHPGRHIWALPRDEGHADFRPQCLGNAPRGSFPLARGFPRAPKMRRRGLTPAVCPRPSGLRGRECGN